MSCVDPAINPALCGIISEYRNILECIGTDFFKQTTECLSAAKKKSASTAEDAKKIALQIVMNRGASDQATLEKNEVLRNLEYMRLSLENIMSLISKKINRRILFSQWAVDEISTLINCTQECLKELSEFVKTNDGEMKSFLIEQAESCLVFCQEYCENHKDRFYKGQCMLESSAIYEPLIAEFSNIFQKIKCCVT